MTSRLEEFRDLVKEVVRSACRTALKEAGFIPDDYLVDPDSEMDGKFIVWCVSSRECELGSYTR